MKEEKKEIERIEEGEEKEERESMLGIVNLIKKIIWPLLVGIVVQISNLLGVQKPLEIFIEEHWMKPDIIYSEKNEIEYFRTDIMLKDGKLRLYPQLIIQEDDTIIRMIALEGVYSNNVLQYEPNIPGFKITEGEWDNVKDLAKAVKTELIKRGKQTEAHFIILMQLEYKNLKSKANKYETLYYISQDQKVTKINETNVEKRGRDYLITIDNWEEELDTIVQDCINAVIE